ncbi:MAG: septation ring formation regulator EzrA [Jatrophihabitans sp.]|nr:septation ring formation regulator EzrA [Jatrophihabitans sp.]
MNSQGRTPRRAVTGRALVLGTVVVLLLVLLASPLNRYFASRSDASNAATQLQQDTTKLAQLKAEQARWGDPGYIQAQARLRLQYAMPGDTVYQVVNHGAKNDIDKTVDTTAKAKQTGSWNTRLWGSVAHASGTS